ncbi:MAG: hypothetical protein M3Z06_07890 [Actinomycetota bacterium]|nr:hypothetical protein [Actinomycetota bacterium]
MRRRLARSVGAVIAGIAAVVTGAGPPAVAIAATAQVTIADLNAQRSANGLPAGITEDATLSAGCAAHDLYMAKNNALTHTEVVGNPGYSPGGATAGQNAVLSRGSGWDAGDPYEDAPLHLDQLLAPRLLTLGSADANGFSCTTTFPGWTRPDPAALIVYSYPGDRATISPSEIASELPYTPGQLVGIPQGARTGPYLIVLVDAPGQSPLDNPATLSHAAVTGPSGRVALKTVDGTATLPSGSVSKLAAYMSPGGFIVPVKPLLAGITYKAHVAVGFGGQNATHDWSFTTSGTDPASSLTARGSALRFRSSSSKPAVVRFRRANGAQAQAVSLKPGATAHPKLDPGSWQACASQPPTTTYVPYRHCLTILVTGKPTLGFGKPTQQGQRLQVRVQFSPVLRGRSATLTLTPLTVLCAPRCRTTAGKTTVQNLVLRRRTLQVPLPAAGHGVRLRLSTPAFQLADAPWAAAHATTTFKRG